MNTDSFTGKHLQSFGFALKHQTQVEWRQTKQDCKMLITVKSGR